MENEQTSTHLGLRSDENEDEGVTDSGGISQSKERESRVSEVTDHLLRTRLCGRRDS